MIFACQQWKQLAHVKTAAISVKKPQKREATPLSAPDALKDVEQHTHIFSIYIITAYPSCGRMNSDEIMATNLMKPLGATSLV